MVCLKKSLRNLALIAAAYTLSQEATANTQQFFDLLREGQQTHFQSHIVQQGSQVGILSNDSPIASQKIDPGCQCLSWLSFDPRRTPLINEANLKQTAVAAILEYLDIDIAASDLHEAPHFNVQPTQHLRILTFDRSYQGILVELAQIQVVFTRTSQGYLLREILNRSFGQIALQDLEISEVTEKRIQAVTGMPSLSLIQDEPRIFARLGSEGRYEFHVSRKVDFAGPMGDHFSLIIDRHDQPLMAFQHKWHAIHTLQAQVPARSPVFRQNTQIPLSFVAVDNDKADKDGKVDTDATMVTLSLNGDYATVVEASNLAQPYQFNVQLGANGTTTVTGDDANLSALTVYSHVAKVNQFVRRFLTAAQASILNRPINVVVDIRDSCNAFFQPNNFSINFFLAGNNCENTALIADVVYHEWGHALDFVTGTRPGIADSAFSEGIGDILSSLLTFSNNMAPGFIRNNQQGIRNLDNNVTQPPLNNDERLPHNQGRIIGGSFWGLQQNLMAVMGQEAGNDYTAKLLLEHLLTTDFYVDSYQALLRLDNVSDDPSRRSPNYCKINRAFSRHNLTAPENCTDLDPGLMVRIVEDDGSGTLQLAASSFGASKIVVCEGNSDNCQNGDTGYMQFSESQSESNKLIFQASAKVNIQAGRTFSVYSFNAREEIVGKKTLRFDVETEEQDLN